MEKTELTQTFEELSIDQKKSAGSTQKLVDQVPSRRRKKLINQSGESARTKIMRRIRKTQYQHYGCKSIGGADFEGPAKDFTPIPNEYEKAESCETMVKKETAIFYDDYTRLHDCMWDDNYIENSRRYGAIMKRCDELGLLSRCVKLHHEPAKKEDILKIHSEELYEKLAGISSMTNLVEVEKIASEYDSVYFNEHTFEASRIAAGCAIALVESIGIGEVQNGIALTRPPGHHAMTNEYCGFCLFNNVAIAAQYALDNNFAERILIVDVDVHHGQATQRTFYNTNKVLYFSIHRYEHGEFWPNLRESNFDYIGEGDGLGYNINFPLNATRRGDSDYLSILFNILLPVAYEYKPDLIIVSGGYDACIGCPEGDMQVTPAFYGHLITLLSGLAKGKIAVCLEGGYFLPSLAEGVAMTIKGLLGDACAMLKPMTQPHETIIHTINDLRIILHKHWKCFQLFTIYGIAASLEDCHKINIVYKGQELKPPYQTRNCYPVHSQEVVKIYTDIITDLQHGYAETGDSQVVCFCYNDQMLLHSSSDDSHVEQPSRVSEIHNIYTEWNLHTRCLNLTPKPFDYELLQEVHDEEYIRLLKTRQFSSMLGLSRDMFYNDDTFNAIIKANECLLAVIDSVFEGTSRSGAAIIRPPGHHAEVRSASGFCFVNNVAVAAKYILNKYSIKRILILDFDIHHGNGTQSIFYGNKEVMYLSIHKYIPRSFFPFSTDAHSSKCGEGDAAGYNVNIPLGGSRLHDIDYLTIFFNVVLPIVYSFAPEVILVSAGFDAGINDPLGHYCLTPECFGHFIQLLKPLAKGRLILALEGGYNLTTVKYSMNICIKTLLGDPLPVIDDSSTLNDFTKSAIKSVNYIHKQYWPVLDTFKNLLQYECKRDSKNPRL